MRLGIQQLDQHLGSTLAPVYLLAGDEPLQMMEAADAIRASAREQGYTEREVFTVEKGFDWESLSAASDNLSLFSERRILDLRLPSGKPGREGSQALRAYAERPPEDTILLMQSGKLDKDQLKSSWVKSLEKLGVLVQIWPLDLVQTQAWIRKRMQGRGLQPTNDAVVFLAERVEGNLLAAAQEVDKLALLHSAGPLDAETVLASVADQARYSIFDLVDAVLEGDVRRSVRMLEGLRGEGVEAILVLWGLAREIRGLTDMARQVARGQAVERVMESARVWNQRKPLVRQALNRLDANTWLALLHQCAELDRSLKGVGEGRIWDELLQLSLNACGDPLFDTAAVCS
jgi:DNA polymerase-3 subunit delta